MKKGKKAGKIPVASTLVVITMREVEIIFTDGLPRPQTPEQILILKEDETRKAIMKFFDMFIDIVLTPSTPKPRSPRKKKKGK